MLASVAIKMPGKSFDISIIGKTPNVGHQAAPLGARLHAIVSRCLRYLGVDVSH